MISGKVGPPEQLEDRSAHNQREIRRLFTYESRHGPILQFLPGFADVLHVIATMLARSAPLWNELRTNSYASSVAKMTVLGFKCRTSRRRAPWLWRLLLHDFWAARWFPASAANGWR